MPMSPQVYADLLYEKIQKHNVKCWLVNTGWTGGRYGIGKVNILFIFIENQYLKYKKYH
jgi:ATP-dependent phosphoenolpyruvate carboxykinase